MKYLIKLNSKGSVINLNFMKKNILIALRLINKMLKNS